MRGTCTEPRKTHVPSQIGMQAVQPGPGRDRYLSDIDDAHAELAIMHDSTPLPWHAHALTAQTSSIHAAQLYVVG